MQQENYYIKNPIMKSASGFFHGLVISGSIFHGTGGYDLCK